MRVIIHVAFAKKLSNCNSSCLYSAESDIYPCFFSSPTLPLPVFALPFDVVSSFSANGPRLWHVYPPLTDRSVTMLLTSLYGPIACHAAGMRTRLRVSGRLLLITKRGSAHTASILHSNGLLNSFAPE